MKTKRQDKRSHAKLSRLRRLAIEAGKRAWHWFCNQPQLLAYEEPESEARTTTK